MADYTKEMQALEGLMKEKEEKEAMERTNIAEGEKIANMMTPLTKPSPYAADILMGNKPMDRSDEMTKAWTGQAKARLENETSSQKQLLDTYRKLKDETTKGQVLALKEKQLQQNQANKDREFKLASQKRMDDLTKVKTEKPSIGETALDRNFAKSYNDYVNEGGAVTINTNLAKMKNVLNKLKTGQVTTGGMAKVTPTSGWTGALLNPSIIEVKEELESAIQNTLRPILGGQFAMIEGQQIMSRAFNPNLSTEANIAKIEAEISNLKKRADIMNESVAYFENSGNTLKGYKGGEALKNITEPQINVASKPKGKGFNIIEEAKASEGKSYDDMSDDELDNLLGL